MTTTARAIDPLEETVTLYLKDYCTVLALLVQARPSCAVGLQEEIAEMLGAFPHNVVSATCDLNQLPHHWVLRTFPQHSTSKEEARRELVGLVDMCAGIEDAPLWVGSFLAAIREYLLADAPPVVAYDVK